MSKYYKFSRYAKKFSEDLAGDIVHDLYIRYFLKHGRNIFEENWSNRSIFVMVKRQWINMQYHRKKYVDVGIDPDEERGDWFDEQDGQNDFMDVIIADELERNIRDALSQIVVRDGRRDVLFASVKNETPILEIYKMTLLGFETGEIAERLGVAGHVVTYNKKQIKKRVMALTNPFNGDKTVVKRIVNLDTWDQKSKDEQAEYELVDYNEYYRLYKYTASGDGLLVRLPQKEKYNPYLLNLKN